MPLIRKKVLNIGVRMLCSWQDSGRFVVNLASDRHNRHLLNHFVELELVIYRGTQAFGQAT